MSNKQKPRTSKADSGPRYSKADNFVPAAGFSINNDSKESSTAVVFNRLPRTLGCDEKDLTHYVIPCSANFLVKKVENFTAFEQSVDVVFTIWFRIKFTGM